MANIKVNEINPAGSELFSDSESFMTELDNAELTSINGGLGVTSMTGPCDPSDFDLCPQDPNYPQSIVVC
ncbi:MAG: hypothetical protein AB4058_03575 [Microcystaceae cyanobacterium]